MHEEERTPEERELDHEIESMSGFWTSGYRAWDWAPWQDGGMRWLEEDREAESGCEGLEGEELRDAMLAKSDAELGWALGLSRELDLLSRDELLNSRGIRLGQDDLLEDMRILFDREREVYVAAGDAGLRVAPLKIVWVSAATPNQMVEFGPVVPWTKGIDMRRAIDRVAAARRHSYRSCKRCHRPTPPEHRSDDKPRGPVCHECLQKDGTVF